MSFVPRFGLWSCATACLMALNTQPASAQFWEKMTNPRITINLIH